MTGLPQGVESQDSEQFFRKVLGVSEGSSLGGMKPILESSKGESHSTLPQRALLPGALNWILNFLKIEICVPSQKKLIIKLHR